jgi:hypothetical protein
MTPGTVVEHVSHATFLPGRMLRSTPPQTPNCSLRSSAAWRHSTSTGQRLHHLTAIARWAACSAVHSSRVMGSLQRGRSPAAARDRSARLSSSVAVMAWPALGVRRHGRFRGVNTFRRRRRFNVAAPKAGGTAPGPSASTEPANDARSACRALTSTPGALHMSSSGPLDDASAGRLRGDLLRRSARGQRR